MHRFDLVALALVVTAGMVIPAYGSSARSNASSPPVVQVRTTDYAFHAPSELQSGWTTFRMTNEGDEAHFLIFWKLPPDKTFDDFVSQVYEPFVATYALYAAGESGRDEMLAALTEALPGWLDLAGMGRGGPGLLSPGRTSNTTIDLPPGDYVMECYMVTEQKQFHNQLGMLRPLTVVEEATEASPPEGDVELLISNSGIDVAGDLRAGKQVFRISVTEAPTGFLGHDLHLARIPEELELSQLISWMSWIDGLTPPAPATFLGGVEQVPPGGSSYLEITLGPGRYVWISEEYAPQGVLHEFRIE